MATKKFEFSVQQEPSEPVFLGNIFYSKYKKALFLQDKENVQQILRQGHELRIMLKELEPGQTVAVSSMMITEECPLLVKKTEPNVPVDCFYFTANRLSGLVAAYAFDNRDLFPDLESPEANALGLKWDNKDENKCRLYLAAVSGSEHFESQFAYWPLICALRKFQLKKITVDPVLKMAKIKNCSGSRMAHALMQNSSFVRDLWCLFPNSSPADIKLVLSSAPPKMKSLFSNAE
ncbi:uncharacterized protein LOC112043868 [Bicyclus anynana]|uniref:Uncharacterized protein LOC112043868 n=1 Tax=Bicyclus anynana TaxID=110368 RepID=A0A6J1MQV6_BICAN|nr:uncharacterized protein LOC112043868 [Bicyclus anynana]XP_052742854.1 uncharacterized protein LOC112043868 [Bicyclus anynana]XP_052742855.1 uncharacterized protein LOC112043868 [Bicyclus anynana]